MIHVLLYSGGIVESELDLWYLKVGSQEIIGLPTQEVMEVMIIDHAQSE